MSGPGIVGGSSPSANAGTTSGAGLRWPSGNHCPMRAASTRSIAPPEALPAATRLSFARTPGISGAGAAWPWRSWGTINQLASSNVPTRNRGSAVDRRDGVGIRILSALQRNACVWTEPLWLLRYRCPQRCKSSCRPDNRKARDTNSPGGETLRKPGERAPPPARGRAPQVRRRLTPPASEVESSG